MDLDQTTPAQLENILWEYDTKTALAANKYIEAKEEFSVLDDNKKSYFAVLETAIKVKTSAEKARQSLISEEWCVWVKGYQSARNKMSLAKVHYDNCQRHWDTIRSILTSKNKEWHRSANN